jgi:SWI/SNF-related matrix-associated actin-dependent regulator 1 of chromatin subfamily A
MITLDDLNDRSALSLLESYEGKNPYIKKLKKDLIRNKKLKLTDNQSKYIRENIDKDPVKINRVLRISTFLGEELQKTQELSFVPEKILIEYILAETDKTYHVYGKVKKNQKHSRLYWIPKTQMIDDPYFEEIDVNVDFEKYAKIDTLQRMLYEHQKEAVKFLLSRKGCILADDMGLGKTLSSVIAALESGAEKILIVCPSSLKINWEREINCFCDGTAIVNGKKWDTSKFTIINYDILKNFHTLDKKKGKKEKIEDPVIEFNQQLVNGKFDLAIIDEAHFLKNPKSIRGKIMEDLCVNHGIDKVWLLTGTPIANRPMDYYNLLKLIKAPIANNWRFFATRYCEGRKFFKTLKNGRRKQIWITDGASNLEELANKTKNIILRRKKEDVLDMPDKTITPVYHELSKLGWQDYNNLWDDYLERRKAEGKRGNIQRDLVELILLRKHIAMEAIPHTIELAENAIEQGQKVIIFTNFTDELFELYRKFEKQAVIHYGPMTTREKQDAVDRFQNDDKIKVFIGNIKSAGVGITLTASNVVIFNSFDWVPGNNEQCEDRCYRIGQKNNVSVYYQLFIDTISIRIWQTLQMKKDIIATIMGEKEYTEEELNQKLIDMIEDMNNF